MSMISYRQALRDTLRSELIRDPDVFLIGEEIGQFEGSYKITAGLLDEFGPKRVRDAPIAEEGSPAPRSAPRCSGSGRWWRS
nr:hypothetical protein [Microlunatus speluncae]